MASGDQSVSLTYNQLSDLVGKIKNTQNGLDNLADVARTGEYADLLNEPENFTTEEWNILWS